MYGQSIDGSYIKRWEIITSDTLAKEKKLAYLDSYIEKAHTEKNDLEEYRALEKKTYLLPFNQAVMLLHKMSPLVQNLKNDSLSGDFLNRSTTLYYKNRHFKEALDYAIQAEKFNERIHNLYNLNSARIDIGNIYYHTQRYQKAKEYFTKAKEYYRGYDNYNHLQGYVSSLYSLGKCYWKLEDFNALQTTINESEEILPKLKPQNRILETAYLNYIKGGNAFLHKKYSEAENYFEKALPNIQRNEDITNQHIIYLYLGKIKWEQNQKEEAIAYFTKIDELFKETEFLNYELREAYNYLRTYYKTNQQTELQLQATESLIALNQQFEKEQQYLTDILHYQLETKELQAEKIALQKQLEAGKRPYGIWLIALVGIAIICTYSFFWWKKRNRKEKIVPLPDVQNERNEVIEEQFYKEHLTIVKNNEVAYENLQVETEQKEPQKKLLSATEQRLLKQLNVFEKEKKYKQPITLDDMALQFGTNRTTLSNFLNTHKGGYNNYFSKLRVTEVINDLKENKELRKKTLQELSVCYGFPNAKAFSSQFKTEMGISPIEFIKNIAHTSECV